MTYSIYRIFNTLDDKTYIGVSKSPKKRISAHLTGSGSPLLFEDVKRHGRDVFMSQIIETHEDEGEANRRAQTFIMRHNALHPFGYNKSIGGQGSSGHQWDWEQKASVAGSNNKRSKLTEEQVIGIYYDNRSRSVISKEYGISTTMVTKIKNGRAWKHVTSVLKPIHRRQN